MKHQDLLKELIAAKTPAAQIVVANRIGEDASVKNYELVHLKHAPLHKGTVDMVLAMHLADYALWSTSGFDAESWIENALILTDLYALFVEQHGSDFMLVHSIGCSGWGAPGDERCETLADFLALSLQRCTWNEEFSLTAQCENETEVQYLEFLQSYLIRVEKELPEVYEVLKGVDNFAVYKDEEYSVEQFIQLSFEIEEPECVDDSDFVAVSFQD